MYHQFKGAVMPHKLLNAIKQHLASPDTSLDNRDDWGLVQKWLLVAAQKDGGGGDISKSKSHLAFCTNTLLSNDDLIHRWITEKLDATVGRCPETAITTVGIHGKMAVVQNMSGIIATEVGRGHGGLCKMQQDQDQHMPGALMAARRQKLTIKTKSLPY